MPDSEAKMRISFLINERPPYKQTPANSAERENQAQRRGVCQQEAMRAFIGHKLFTQPCNVSIEYWRATGQSDGANIIGGVLDALEGIIYQNDRQAVEILYIEHEATGNDRYQVIVREI